MSSVLEAPLRKVALALIRLYYPSISIDGRERLPATGPVIFVLNHPNGLLDPLLLHAATGRPAHFLAKSTLFGNPFGRLAMAAFGCFPVYRVQDSDKDGDARAADRAARNEATFARCREALARGEALALFPEGTSHSDPRLRPLKTGAARIALSAEQERGGALGVRVVPVGLGYENKTLFQSRVLLVVGDAIDVKPRLAAMATDDRAAVDGLTRDIRAALDDVVAQAESRELLEGVARVAAWAAPDAEHAHDLGFRNARTRAMLDAYADLSRRDPKRLDDVVAAARGFARTLGQMGVDDPWALETPRLGLARIVGAIVGALALAPFALVGALLGWAPYRLAGVVAGRATSEEDVLGTIKLIAGSAFLAATWIAEAVVVGVTVRPWWAWVPLVAGPACGYAALRFAARARAVREAVRLAWLRGTNRRAVKTLAEQRRAIADDVARALAMGTTGNGAIKNDP